MSATELLELLKFLNPSTMESPYFYVLLGITTFLVLSFHMNIYGVKVEFNLLHPFARLAIMSVIVGLCSFVYAVSLQDKTVVAFYFITALFVMSLVEAGSRILGFVFKKFDK